MAEQIETMTPRSQRIRVWLGRVLWLLAGSLLTLLLFVLSAWLWGPALLAHRTDWPFERQLGRTMIDRAAAQGAAQLTPPSSARPQALETGRIVYLGACSQCHGADADGKGWLGMLSYPPASALNDADTQARSDAELYWIIANGLSFTGMPGFRDRLSDEQIWAVVTYLRSLSPNTLAPVPVTPTPTTQELAGADSTQTGASRGAALYTALGCVNCHGAVGNAPGRLELRATDQRAVRAIREGTEEGMPAYSTDVLSEADLRALLQYIATFRTSRP
uniref:C-type cytochrome n=1 Tax=Thermomicrobium roseum TaxID=500 RepID=A0A7C1K3G2_THERO